MVSKGDRVIVLSPGSSKDLCPQICTMSQIFSFRKLNICRIHSELFTIWNEVEGRQVMLLTVPKICREQELSSDKTTPSTKNSQPYKRGDHS